jgi:hypothetical protein
MTGAERSWASHYEIDDVVRYTRGSKAVGIDACRLRIGRRNRPSRKPAHGRKTNSELATYDPRRLTGVSVYRRSNASSPWATASSSPPPTNRLALPIATSRPSNRSIPMADSPPASTTTARSNSTPREHRHFDHGYAVTSHSSQGLTAERVLVHADTSVHPGPAQLPLRLRLHPIALA